MCFVQLVVSEEFLRALYATAWTSQSNALTLFSAPAFMTEATAPLVRYAKIVMRYDNTVIPTHRCVNRKSIFFTILETVGFAQLVRPEHANLELHKQLPDMSSLQVAGSLATNN